MVAEKRLTPPQPLAGCSKVNRTPLISSPMPLYEPVRRTYEGLALPPDGMAQAKNRLKQLEERIGGVRAKLSAISSRTKHARMLSATRKEQLVAERELAQAVAPIRKAYESGQAVEDAKAAGILRAISESPNAPFAFLAHTQEASAYAISIVSQALSDLKQRATERDLGFHQSVSSPFKGPFGSLAGAVMDHAGKILDKALGDRKISWHRLSVSELDVKLLEIWEYRTNHLGNQSDNKFRIDGRTEKEALAADPQVAGRVRRKENLHEESADLLGKLRESEEVFQGCKEGFLRERHEIARRKAIRNAKAERRTLAITDIAGSVVSAIGTILALAFKEPSLFFISVAGNAFSLVSGIMSRVDAKPRVLHDLEIEQRMLLQIKDRELEPLERERAAIVSSLERP